MQNGISLKTMETLGAALLSECRNSQYGFFPTMGGGGDFHKLADSMADDFATSTVVRASITFQICGLLGFFVFVNAYLV